MGDVMIRPATGSDIPYLYEICLKTGDAGKDATDKYHDSYLVGQMFAAPYLFYPDAIALVAEEDSVPRGYILSAPDTGAFYRWMEEVWLPPLRRRYGVPAALAACKSDIERGTLGGVFWVRREEDLPGWLASYPAHLHIDLLPEIQGRGTGRALLQAIFDELRARKVPGLHLGVNGANTGAIAFYKKQGLQVLENTPWGFNMGIRF
ncbi:MAG: GNAT family N-acetyltransferase [Treponema sp.]|jgi:ribosomal protein S18 acetylase RimI-like enzyme|nr:GNAT family N-acetyltransferase [Treponema sp.]